MKLSSTQENIVKQKGNLIVRASAGTGKTHTLVTKIVKELEENHSHKVMAAITFTIKAAQEIKDRLSIDVTHQFIGTNNSFVIEEIIKPFMKDVYGSEFNVDMDTDYSKKIETFDEGVEEIKKNGVLSSYTDNKRNFIFELGRSILRKSEACQLYLTSKYYKIYIDEYQDCDKDMHVFFMHICDELKIELFIVGDEKQSIYIWRGAYPEAFKSIWSKDNFNKIFMVDNFRSCQQIQNYTNILFEETRGLYKPVDNLENIVWIEADSDEDWATRVLGCVDSSKSSALLRFSNLNAKDGSIVLSDKGVEYIFIPQIPIADIMTETSWLYAAVASYCVLDRYSVYDLVSEIPVEGDESKKNINRINSHLEKIKGYLHEDNKESFKLEVNELSLYLNYSTLDLHLDKLYHTVSKDEFHVAFDSEKYNHVAITFHSSKGLEFEQVIIFTEDYRLDDISSIYNHYVASTRAKNKLIIVKTNNYNSRRFEHNLTSIYAESQLSFAELFTNGK